IGLYALAFPNLFSGAEVVYGALYPYVQVSGAALFATRFGLLFLLFLAPTFFMGATMPLVFEGLVEDDRSLGARTSFLYGVNIAGAVAGVVATCYWAVPTLGMEGSSRAGAAGNIAIALVAAVAFARRRPAQAAAPETVALGSFFPAAA